MTANDFAPYSCEPPPPGDAGKKERKKEKNSHTESMLYMHARLLRMPQTDAKIHYWLPPYLLYKKARNPASNNIFVIAVKSSAKSPRHILSRASPYKICN